MTKFTESVNPIICEKLSKMSFTQFQKIFKSSTTKRHDDYDFLKEYNKVIKYCQLQIKNKCKLDVKYTQSVVVDGVKYGRMSGYGACMQRLYNGFRGILMDGITYDLDMKCCHNCILYKLCLDNDINASCLYKYINERDKIIEDMAKTDKLNRAEVKNLFLKSLNKEELIFTHNKKKIKNKFFLEYDSEIKTIQKEIIKLYPDYGKYIDEYKKYNVDGSHINLILCDNENRILQKALKYINNETDHIISCIMFDGFMIEPIDKTNFGLSNIEELIKKLNKITKEDLIKWDYKPHNTEFLQIIEDMEFKDIDSFTATDIIELGNHIINGLLKEKIIRCNDEIFLITKDKIINNDKSIKAEIYKLISENDFHFGSTVDKDGEPIPRNGKVHKCINDIIECIRHLCPIDNNFINNIWSNTLGKIYFNNGYYDFKKKEFIKGGYNRTFVKIEYDYNSNVEQKYYDEVYDKLLYPIFSINKKEVKDGKYKKKVDEKHNKTQTELLEHFLYKISRMIAGMIEDKEWILFEGQRNCGKGAICDLLKNSFGNYIKTTNSSNFTHKKSNVDSAKCLSWMVDFMFKRIGITSEADVNDTLAGSIIKKWCSGGDYIEARKNHKDELEFKMQCGLLICCNDCPPIEPKDALEKCVEYQLKSKFINDEFPESEMALFEGFQFYEIDDEFKAKFSTRPEIILAFTNIIINAFNKKITYPIELKKVLDCNKEESDYSKLFNLFIFTNDKKDTIFNNKLEHVLKDNKIPFSVKKIRPLLMSKGAVDFRTSSNKGLSNIKLKIIENDDHEVMEETNALDL
jgi:hypothetical protein